MKNIIMAGFMAGLLLFGTAEMASSSISTYTDYASWSASTTNIQTVPVNGPAQTITPGLTANGVIFSGTSSQVAITSLNEKFMLSNASWAGTVSATLPSDVTSVGVYLYAIGNAGYLQVSTGGQNDYSVYVDSTGTFFGLTSDSSFLSSLSFTPQYYGNGSYMLTNFAIDQFSYSPGKASPVPIPSSMLLLGTGIVGLAATGRRKRS